MTFPAENASPHLPPPLFFPQSEKILHTIVEYVQLLEETIVNKCRHLIGIQRGLFKNV